MNDTELMNTTDATKWAEEFVADAENRDASVVIERHHVLGWFASAIGAGISRGQRPVAMMDIDKACEVMHNAYEKAAPGAGWETNPASRKPWAEVPEENKDTMRAAVGALREFLITGVEPE